MWGNCPPLMNLLHQRFTESELRGRNSLIHGEGLMALLVGLVLFPSFIQELMQNILGKRLLILSSSSSSSLLI